MMNRLTPITSSTIRFGSQKTGSRLSAKPVSQAQVRFGNGVPGTVSGTEQKSLLEAVANFAQDAFNLKERTANWIDNSGTPKFIGNIAKAVTEKLFDWDYQIMAKLPVAGSVVVEPPIGALIILLFGFTLTGRLFHALHRAIGGDRRELRDIMIRDLPTFSLILFALKPSVKKLSQIFQKLRHITLLPKKGDAFSYSVLKDLYTVQSKENLAKIFEMNKEDPQGLLNALENTGKKLGALAEHNEQYKPLVTAFDAYHKAIENAFNAYRKAIEEAAKNTAQGAAKTAVNAEAGESFKDAAAAVIQKVEPVETLKNAAATVFDKFKGLESAKALLGEDLRKGLPSFPEIFASYAKGSRVWANIISYAVVIAALGYGVTAINKWITEREYKKLKENGGEQGQGQAEGLSQGAEGLPAEASINPMSPAMAPSFEPQVSQYQQYAQYPQYPAQSAYGYSNPYSSYPQQAYSANAYASNPWNATAYPQTYPYGYYQ